uniref:Fe2OG dioxygenase domain-containing protein n=1 Tax=Alexandrium monilatum TaxID=311494 RepID=A0A7S4Q8J9_9DINO
MAALRRCEYEALPADGEVEVGDIFAGIQAKPLSGVTWLGWRAEPLFFGLQKLIASCTLNESVSKDGDDLCERVLEALEALDSVQSARLLSTEAYQGDPFDVCSRLFSTSRADVGSKGLRCLGAAGAEHFRRCGFAVLEDFLPATVAAGVAGLVEASLAALPDFQDDGMAWRRPEPRNARGDVATWLRPGCRPATDEVFAEHVLPAFRLLEQDLQALLGLRGVSEQQLAWYPGDGSGYAPHTDAHPDDDVESDQRKVTAIFYCNEGWLPEHGGALRLWLPQREGGGAQDVEPRGGMLLLFLSGCVRHEVRPCHRGRVAVTCWFW